MTSILARLRRGALVAAALLVAPTAGAQTATLALINAHVVTVDSAKPEAEAVAIAGDRILVVGTNDEIRRHMDARTHVLDVGGRLVIPGFIEGHGHLLGLGDTRRKLDLTTARTWDEIVARVAAAARAMPRGTWIIGHGWHQEKWDRAPSPTVEGYPVHASLSAASPNHPVLLEHASGHASFVNGVALRLSGITNATRDPAGGEIVRDATGAATGLLRESAQDAAERALARARAGRTRAQREAEMRQLVELAGADALAKGVTSFHDAGSSFEAIDVFRKMADERKLPVRLYPMVRGEPLARMDSLLGRYRLIGHGAGFLTVRTIKRQIDGALGSHGAWLLEPYADLSRSTGLALEQPASLARVAELAVRHGYQLATHAIGDRANREVLDVYEKAARTARLDTLRWRIEHAQHVEPSDVARFARLGVIASMQGIHTISDAPWIPAKLGPERTERESYLFRSLWDAGAVITNGTDAPVEDVNPIPSFYGMVARIDKDGRVFVPAQRLTRAEALRAYTLNNAYASFQERELGSLTPGKYADVVVMSKDIMRIPEGEIPSARVDYTIVAGTVRYRRDATP
ncbi:MAG TPA: amidohydrolase [Gemmatimonadaceae bacterium]|nr:amidohydrolase [Gemmatimonadaceae bacterium]